MSTLTLAVVRIEMTEPGGVLYPVAAAKDGEPDFTPVMDASDGGRATIPGSTIAGSLRRHFAERADVDVDTVFGHARGDDISRSLLTVHGVKSAGNAPEVRNMRSTAIDRHRQAAAASTLRSIDLLGAGTEFDVYLSWAGVDAETSQQLIAGLRSWAGFVGAGASVGCGWTVARGVRWSSLDLAQDADLLRYLRLSGPDLFDEVCTLTQEGLASSDRTRVQVGLEIVSALHCGAGQEIDAEGKSVNAVVKRGDQALVPARTIKGIMRSRAEFILVSLGHPVCYGSAGEDTCLVCRIFGYGGVRSARAAVRFLESEIVGAEYESRMHVAIDRFTGGAMEGALYQDRVVVKGSLLLVMERLTDDEDTWAWAKVLVRLVVEDLNEGFVGFGGSQSRGYGRVRTAFGAATGPGDSLPDLAQAQQALAKWGESA